MAEERQNNSQVPLLTGVDGILVTFPTTKTVQATPDYGTAANTVAEGNDSRFPTAGQTAALAGTNGVPGLGNEFVTSTDPRVAAVAEVKDQGVLEGTNIKKLNFSTNMAVTIVGDQANITSTGGGTITLEDEGTPVTGAPHTTLNFTGAGVTVSDAGGSEATVNIPGSSGITLEDEGSTVTGGPHGTLNFVGGGVNVVDAGGGEATVTIPTPSLTIQEEGVGITATPHTTLNFVGGGITAADAGGGVASITVPTPALTIKEEGSNVTGTPHSIINFIGSTVTAADAGGGQVNVTVTGSSGVSLEDEGTPVTGTPHSTLNFTGAGVTVTDAGAGEATVNIPGSSGITIEDEGSTVTGGPHGTLNFVGGGVTATDAGGGEATITIPTPALTIQDENVNVTGTPHTTLNFTGTGVKVTDAGGGEATITIPLSGVDAVVDASGGGDFTTIQGAIDFGASSIFIRNGTYVQSANLVIDHADAAAITLIGESRDGVIIDFGAAAFSMLLQGLLRTSAGTVTVTNNSSVVTGSGTSFITGGVTTADRLAIFQGGSTNEFSSFTAEVTGAPTLETSVPVRQYNGQTVGTLSFVAFKPRGTVHTSNITFQNSTAALVRLDKCTDITFENCLFKDGLYGIRIEGPVYNLSGRFCEFLTCTTNFLRIEHYLDEPKIQSCIMRHISNSAPTSNYAIAMATTSAHCSGMKITDTSFLSLNRGLLLAGMRGLSVKGCTFRAINSFVLFVTNLASTRNNDGIVFANNRFEQCGNTTDLLADVETSGAGHDGNVVHFVNNYFLACNGTMRGVNCLFTNNSVEENTSISGFGGFLLNFRDVSHNTFETVGNTAEAVVYSNANRCTVTNNRFSASRGHDVIFAATSPSKCIVTGNTSQSPTNGMISASSDYGVISNNTVQSAATSKTMISVTLGRNVVSGNVIQFSGGATNTGISIAAPNCQVKDNVIIVTSGAQTTGIAVTAGSTAKTWVEGNLISTGFTSQLTNAGTATQLGSETTAGFLTA